MDPEAKTKAEKELERQKWAMKHFDYAESAIKEWIAEILGEEVSTIFDDYTGESDVLGIKSNGDHYTLYLTPFPSKEKPFEATVEDLKKNKELSKASSIMFDAVHTVFLPVMKTMINLKYSLEDVFPKFEEDKMCFKLVMMNKLQMKRNQIINVLQQVNEKLELIRKVPKERLESPEGKDALEKIIKFQSEHCEKLNEISVEECEKLQKIVDETNDKFDKSAKLYICLEKNKKDINQDYLLRRMPEFGMRYQDPDEETLIDKIKQEYHIND